MRFLLTLVLGFLLEASITVLNPGCGCNANASDCRCGKTCDCSPCRCLNVTAKVSGKWTYTEVEKWVSGSKDKTAWVYVDSHPAGPMAFGEVWCEVLTKEEKCFKGWDAGLYKAYKKDGKTVLELVRKRIEIVTTYQPQMYYPPVRPTVCKT